MRTIQFFAVLRGLAMGLFSPIWILYLVDQGYDLLQIGLLGTIFEIAKLIFEVPSGTFADRYGIKLSIAGSFFLSVVTWAFFPFIDTLIICILAMIIWALSDALISGSLETWMSRVVGEERFGKEVMKNTQILIAFIVVGSIISGYLYSYNMFLPFIIVVALYTILFIWMSIFVKVPIVKSEHEQEHIKESFLNILKQSLKIVFHKRRVLLIVLSGFFTALTYDMVSRYWQPLLNEMGFSETGLGYIFALAGIFALILLGITMKLEKKIETNPYMSLTIVESVSLLLVGVLTIGFKPLGAIATSILLAVEDVRYPIVISYLNRFFPDNYKNTLFSLNSGVGALGEILSGVIFGIIALEFGLTTTFLVAAIFLLPAIIIYWVVPKIHDKTSITVDEQLR
ncbi:MFS transporter [uncultured Anoxybacillus sp.]|uniref:MFS transporter n=1 Tax=uncultured Anoxybacillus sp. TaxID=263860 RepID=UPI00261739D8|nr:MFS transporter [uncultured Anoxybacillus sp.]